MHFNMITWLYKWLPIIFGCHCMDSRSFHFKGRKFPICARCTGELAGIIVAAFTYAFFHTNAAISAILLIPLCVDGFTQSLTKYESNNLKRFVTGTLFGYGLCVLFLISSGVAFRYGCNIGRGLV